MASRVTSAFKVRALGSATLHLAYVAAGLLEGCVDFNVKIWDLAAAIPLVRAAGGEGTEKAIRAVTRKAADGDLRAASILLARTWARRRGRPVQIELPPIEKSADLAKAVVKEMMERRTILNRTGETVVRFLPPFIVGKKHVDAVVSQLETVLANHTQPASVAANRSNQ